MSLKFAIYTCPPIPTEAPSPDASSKDSGFWQPQSITLVYTPTTAPVVDCPATVNPTRELAEWIKSQLPLGSTLKYFVCTHAHGDHFFGLPVLQEQFPGLQAFATKAVTEGIDLQQSPEIMNSFWEKIFFRSGNGSGLPDARSDFQALPTSNEFNLDGHLLKLYDVSHGDTDANSFIHVPELDLVVAGDIVYNGDCHQWLGEASSSEKRTQWLAALEEIRALRPKIVVPGHTFTPTSTPDENLATAMLTGTADYINGFAEELAAATSEQNLFERMRSRYDRWNLYLLAGSSQAGWNNRTL
ncbi:metallo-beta-lactamase superfamily [Fusarium tjaetaba]|uniref:Metallo-beta-lactamase superfamily n=1 Tax=Fusarium tjaetaba TaxID=1567544 RepID=A0A8H5VA32_9HYPO|nr:metallo-beta-lactamase superfamily [Fusarium tjaetaba]KAF5616772.1 metallo-beta-lactamase superfamily [Fusarium tjaetaba]